MTERKLSEAMRDWLDPAIGVHGIIGALGEMATQVANIERELAEAKEAVDFNMADASKEHERAESAEAAHQRVLDTLRSIMPEYQSAEARVKEVESLLLAKTKTMTAHIDARLTEERLKFEALQELDEVRATLAQRDEALGRVRVRAELDEMRVNIDVDSGVFGEGKEDGLERAIELLDEALTPAPAPERSVEARFEDCDHCTYPAYHERVCLNPEPAPEPAPKEEACGCEVSFRCDSCQETLKAPGRFKVGDTAPCYCGAAMVAFMRSPELDAAREQIRNLTSALPDAVKQVVGEMLDAADEWEDNVATVSTELLKRWASTLSAALEAK